MNKVPHICTIGQLSQETGISEYTIRCWVKQGEFKTLRSGKKYLINFDIFIDYLNSKEVESTKQNATLHGIRKVVG